MKKEAIPIPIPTPKVDVCPHVTASEAMERLPPLGGRMSEKIQPILRELKDKVGRLYGDRLKGVYLFGSYARGEANEESDVDVLIVLDSVNNYSEEIDRTGDVISKLSLQSGVTISRVFVSEERWRTDQTNFFLNVREEAVPA